VLKFQVRDDDALLTRLKRRARADDTDEVIRHRFNVYREQPTPVMRYYREELNPIDEVGAIDEVFTRGATSPTAIAIDPRPAGSLAMKEILCNARR
jgi:adenylate kinase